VKVNWQSSHIIGQDFFRKVIIEWHKK